MHKSPITPHKDYGLFGPDSITWKVFLSPTSLTLGFQRTVVVEMFEPFLLASVAHTEAVMNRPSVRYDRTMQYVSTVAFHDSESVVKASDMLMRIHSHIRGQEPLSGLEYDANAPQAQLWIHLTQWHSVLYTYETFGPGPLTEEEDRQYWAECRLAAAFQTIDPKDVPRNRAEMRAYYARMRALMAATETTQITVDHLLNASQYLLEKAPPVLKLMRPLIVALFRSATIATMPHWLRKLGGIKQGKLTDWTIIRAFRLAYRLAPRSPVARLKFIKMVSPQTVPVVAPALLGIAPDRPVTVSPQDAWASAGRPLPRDQYAQLCASRPARPASRAPKDGGEEALLQFS